MDSLKFNSLINEIRKNAFNDINVIKIIFSTLHKNIHNADKNIDKLKNLINLMIYGINVKTGYALSKLKMYEKEISLGANEMLNIIEDSKECNEFYKSINNYYKIDKLNGLNKLPYKKTFLWLFFSEIVVKDQYHAREFIKNGKIVIDCGANIGIFSIFASYLNPKGKIYAIEPERNNFMVLKNMIGLFKASNVKAFNFAVGENNGSGYLYINKLNIGGHSLDVNFINKHSYNKRQKINVLKIDYFIKRHRIKSVDFIKMDIEGYEKQALKGAKETIRRFKLIIVMSAYHKKEDKKELADLLLNICNDYKIGIDKRFEEVLICKPEI
ncbi:MAG: FkbM family methyltransferase [Candidatus Anstonellales archaeon]